MYSSLLSLGLIFYSFNLIHSQIAFEGVCTTDVKVNGYPTVDGNDEFEIDLYETKFLPDNTIYCKKHR